MAKGIKRKLRKAKKNVKEEIELNRVDGSRFASGLASEGYSGGYLQALRDVELALEGGTPSTRGYWTK